MKKDSPKWKCKNHGAPPTKCCSVAKLRSSPEVSKPKCAHCGGDAELVGNADGGSNYYVCPREEKACDITYPRSPQKT